MADSPISALLIVASEVLGRAREDLEHDWESSSFVMLGGTSLRAAELVALAETRASQKLSLDGLLDDRPLAEVLNMATEFIPATPAEICSGDLRDLSAGQHAMVLAEQLFGGVSSHLLFSADIRGRLDHARMTGALGRLTRRHEALRTIFVRDGDEVRRRVLISWQPRVVELTVPAGSSEPVSWAHSVLAPSSGTFLQPFEQPPVVFALARVSATHHVLSVLIHHGVTDGWSVGLLWRELAAGYQEAAAAEMRSEDPAP